MTDSSGPSTPTLRQVVLDCEDARALAEFYRQLLGFHYRPGDDPPADGMPDTKGEEWLVLCDATGSPRLAFQHVPFCLSRPGLRVRGRRCCTSPQSRPSATAYSA